jgi:hypothetical protein
MDFTKTNAMLYFTLLTIHEVNHIFSMNSDLFEYFIDSNGNPIPKEKVVTTSVINGESRSLIITPKVVQAARKYFGCDTMMGVELENQGGSGTKGSHWESRVMLGDFMIGESYAENVVSEISLALMEDSGWYQVNYYTGGLFRYGKKQGCEFVNTKCIVNDKTKFHNEFSTTMNAPMCFSGRLARGVSSLQTGLEVSSLYRYWADSSKGGYTNADFCPVAIDSFVDTNNLFAGSCTSGVTGKYPASMGETIGANASCFMSSLTPTGDNSAKEFVGMFNAICYDMTCDDSNKIYSFKVGSTVIKCPTEGGTVKADGFDGEVHCPDYNLVCTKSVACSDAVDCANKKSTPLDAVYNYVANNDQSVPTFAPATVAPSPVKSATNTTTKKNSSNYIMVNLILVLFLVLLI